MKSWVQKTEWWQDSNWYCGFHWSDYYTFIKKKNNKKIKKLRFSFLSVMHSKGKTEIAKWFHNIKPRDAFTITNFHLNMFFIMENPWNRKPRIKSIYFLHNICSDRSENNIFEKLPSCWQLPAVKSKKV